jgi:hypothetical protein
MKKLLNNLSKLLFICIFLCSCNLQRKYYPAYTYRGPYGNVTVYDYYYVDPREEKKLNKECNNCDTSCTCGDNCHCEH